MGISTERQAWTPHDLVYGPRMAAEPRVSPDGTRLVYALAQADPARPEITPPAHLVRSAIDGSEATQLTDPGHHDVHPRWSPDGARIAFASDRVPGSGLLVVPAEAGEPTEPIELARHPLPIDDLAWSPDGRRIAYTVAVDPPEAPQGPGPVVRVTRRLDYKEDVRGYLGERRKHLYVVDAETGPATQPRRLTTDGRDHTQPSWSPDGRWLAVRVADRVGLRSALLLLDADGGGDAHQVQIAEDGGLSLHAWSHGADRLLLAGEPGHTAQTDLYLYTLATGALERLTDDLQVLPHAGYPNSVPPSPPVWVDERRVLLHAVHRGASGLYLFDVESGELDRLTEWEAQNVGLSTDLDARLVAQSHASPTAIGDVVVFDRATRESRRVTAHNDELIAARPFARWERFETERAGLVTESWLLFPPDFDPAGRYPLILDVHGGPHGNHGYAFGSVDQCLASAGFLVVCPNPRGSSTYGRTFATQVLEDWGGEDYLDLLAVVDALTERSYVDPGRLGVYGYSYGGFMTSWIIGHTDRFQAAVCGAPCFDLTSMYGSSDITPFWGPVQWGGPPHARPEWYREHSPSTYAQQARTPTLIVHGEADQRCPIGQGEELFTALSQAGCEVEFARYPGASHQFQRVGPAAQRVDVLERVLAWFQRHL
jgi:dipeptidyl aminopeptidase/acylaminoacyl peptidase